MNREPAVAGSFYPDNANELEKSVRALMEKAEAWVAENQDAAADLLAPRLALLAEADAVKTRAMAHFDLTEEA